MPPKNFERLGEIIFNGTILFFSISFGLFPFAVEKAGIEVLKSMWFDIAIFVIVLAGLGSLVFSYIGILKKNKHSWIIASLICLLLMIFILSILYIQIFDSIVQKLQSVQSNFSNSFL